EIQPENATVNFCHQSVKDFLLHDCTQGTKKWYHTTVGEANLLIFEACWRYLSSEEFEYGKLFVRPEKDRFGMERLRKIPYWELKPNFPDASFLLYASSVWEDHAIASYPTLLSRLTIKIMSSPILRDVWLL